MKTTTRLYLSKLINSLGSWLTFMAIALLLQEKYGSQVVAYSFLIQSIPALLFSRFFAKLLPQRISYKAYILGNFLLAINVLALTISTSLWSVYTYLLLLSTMNAVLNPLNNTLVGMWVRKDDLSAVQTRLGAISATLLTLAPPLGAAISAFFGYKILFMIDAISFLLAATILYPQPKRLNKDFAAPLSLVDEKEAKKINYTKALKLSLRYWYFYLCIGAILNGIEFAIFEKHSFSKQDIGWTLGAWGFGNLLAFLSAKKMSSLYERRGPTLAFLYAIGLLLFVVTSSLASILFAFVIAGFTYALLGGSLRAQVQLSIPPKSSAQMVWAIVNERLSIINIFFYATVGYLIGFINPLYIGIILFVVTLSFAYDLNRKSEFLEEVAFTP